MNDVIKDVISSSGEVQEDTARLAGRKHQEIIYFFHQTSNQK
jgi:hypothetical protein